MGTAGRGAAAVRQAAGERPTSDVYKRQVMHRAKIAMYDTVENVFARAQELLELGLSVPQVKIGRAHV